MAEEVVRIAIREITEEEALHAWQRLGHMAPNRFAIVAHGDPEKALGYGLGVMLGLFEGADWIQSAISIGRDWERTRRNVVLVLTHEQRLIERVCKIVDVNAWHPPTKIAADPAVAVAKFDRIARTVVPEAFLDVFTNEREMIDGTRRHRKRREALDG